MAGISYYHISQIPEILEECRMITIGQVLSMFRQQKFLSLIISDTTSTAEATIYQRKSQYEQLELPRIGDTIEVLGTCLTKPIVGGERQKLFLKIRIERWRVLEFQEQLQLSEKILCARQKRLQKKLLQQVVVLKKRIRVKQKAFSDKDMVDIRSLIFSYLYIIFENNSDIHSYLFIPVMVKNHSLCKEYAKDNQIPEKSMQDAISKGLVYLLSHEIIELKHQQPGDISLSAPEQYVIKKRFFERLVVDIEEFVYQKKATGATLQQVTKAMNEKMGKLKEEDYLFNFKFIQKILMDLIKDFRIYKTSDKKIYPYSH